MLNLMVLYERSQPFGMAYYYNNYGEKLSYDKRGNINSLERHGTYEQSNRFYHGEIDDLNYRYSGDSRSSPQIKHVTNKLRNVTDLSHNDRGYDDSSSGYQYDANGNISYDPSKKVTVTYNHLDLPTKIEWTSSSPRKRLDMIYDAGGNLLTRTSSIGGSVTERTDYIGGLEYVSSTGAEHDLKLRSLMHSEGRAVFDDARNYVHHYNISDHLGNVRLVYTDTNRDGYIQLPEDIVQEQHFYPFGMKMGGSWMSQPDGGKSEYGYNGIERVDEFDLGVNMAFYRTLDPVIGRWWSVDPKAEYQLSLSPYNAMNNSPVVFNDPNGDIAPLVIAGIMAIGGIANLASNWNNVSSFSEGAAYFVNGAVSYGVGTVNPVAGGALLVASNLGLQAANGDLPTINSAGDVLNLAVDVGFDFIGPYAAGMSFQTQFFNAGGSLSAKEVASLAKEGVSVSTTAAGGIGARQVAVQTTAAASTATAATQATTQAASSGILRNVIPRTEDVPGHIFRNSKGHVNPSTATSQNRYINLFEDVANNANNVNSGVLSQYQRQAGTFTGYSQTFRSGQQVWAQVDATTGRILNAGINIIPK